MGRLSWLVVALITAFAAPGQAQPSPLTITCNDVRGRAVTGVQVTNGIIAKATVDQGDRPVIEYDPRSVSGISPQQQLFIYAHECGHHALGHELRGQSTPVAQEQEADCYGIRALMARAGVTANDVRLLQADMQQLGSGDARRLPWAKRTYDLDRCLATETSDRGTAQGVRSGAGNADNCVVHRDSDDAIVNESRDGLTIDGLYTVANSCARDVACTFTIQTGTRPAADIDAGSWSRFRTRKTRTEQHSMKAGSQTEFRFRETIDDAPANESVDFRVLTACQ